MIYTGAETGPAVVRGFDAVTGTPLFDRLVSAPAFTGGVRVATADVTRDGYPDLIAALGPGGEPRVTVLDGKTGDPVPGPLGSFLAYAPTFAGGVGVAAGDVDGDGVPDVITAAGAGGGPHVRAFSGTDGSLLASFFAFEPEFAGGVSVSAADLTGDRRADLVVGAGAGGAPRVRVFDLATGLPLAGPRGSFFAFDPALRTGVSVATDTLAADVNADAVPDIAVGTGPGTAARVAVFSGKDAAALAEFAPFAAGTTAGVRVALAYVDENATADVVAATGPGVPSVVRVFSGLTGQPVVQPTAEFAPFGAGSTAGVALAASNDPVVTSFTVTPQTQTVHAAEEEATVTLSLETSVPVGRVEFYDNWTGTGDIDHATVYPDSPGTTAAATFSHLYEVPGTYWQYVWAEVYDPDGNYVETAFWYADVTVVTAIGDYVWVDEDEDGLQGAEEPPAVGVRVDLYRDGSLVDTKFTNDEGKYLFDGLIPTGMYQVRVTNPDPAQYVFTVRNASGGNNSSVDSSGQTITFTVPGARDLTKDAGLVPVSARIHDVTFDGPGHIWVEPNPGDPEPIPTDPPHWLDNNLDGSTMDEGDRTLPVAYVHGTQMVVSSDLEAPFPLDWLSGHVYVRGTGTDGLDVPATYATVSGSTISVSNAAVTGLMPDAMTYYAAFIIEWEVSFDNGQHWSAAGQSSNETFVILTESTDAVYYSPLYLTTTAAQGARDPATAVPQMWANSFATVAVSQTLVNPNGVKTTYPLYYYLNWRFTASTAADLLAGKDGSCRAWTDYFLYNVVKIAGAPQDQVGFVDLRSNLNIEVADKNGNKSLVAPFDFLVNNWSFGKNATSLDSRFPYFNRFPVANPQSPLWPYVNNPTPALQNNWSYDWNGAEVADAAGLPGQNTPYPPGNFGFHIVAAYNQIIYDPSYGKKYTGVTWLDDWETASVAGFMRLQSELVNGDIVTTGWQIVQNPPGRDFRFKTSGWIQGKVDQLTYD